MIIGNGFLAQNILRITHNEDVVYFASGVSNSLETSPEQFHREEILLKKNLETNCRFIYFSSISVESHTSNSLYIKHKIHMENLIKNKSNGDYLIFRLPQLVGKSMNPNTLINYLFFKIKNELPFNLFNNSKRNLIDIEDAVKIVDYINRKNFFTDRVINVASPESVEVTKIVSVLEKITLKKANLAFKNDESDNFDYNVECSNAIQIANKIEIFFGEKYFEKVLMKYYKS